MTKHLDLTPTGRRQPHALLSTLHDTRCVAKVIDASRPEQGLGRSVLTT